MADVSIVASEVASTPQDYTLPGAQEILLRAVGCQVSGASAAGAFLPALQLLDPAGHVMFTAVNRSVPVAAGGSALVSWFPGGGIDQAGSSSGSGGTITDINSPAGTLSVTNPTGPTTSVDMPTTGVTAGSYGDSGNVGQFTVDAEGRLTAAANVAISGGSSGVVQASTVTITSGDLTTSSNTFVDLTGATITMTTGAHRCLVIFSASGHAPSGGSENAAVDLAIDGTRQGQTYGLVINQGPSGGSNINMNFSFSYLTGSLSAASHTFKIQWRVDLGVAATMFASAGVTPIVLTVIELGI